MKLSIFRTGEVCVSPYLPFGGDCNLLQAIGLTTLPKNRLWLPVFCYLIEHDNGQRVLVDTGWHRLMSPDGVSDWRAQVRSLGSLPLFFVNQGRLPQGQAIDEQLTERGIKPEELDYVVLTHLDCDHANGLQGVAKAKKILCSADELHFAQTSRPRTRYQSIWWKDTPLQTFDWNCTDGPAGKSYDLFGDGSVLLINIPGHSAGQVAVKITGKDGKFVLLCADGGYAEKSWKEMITSGISADKTAQRRSLEWIKAQSEAPRCLCVLASHDSAVQPKTIEF